MPDLHRSSAIAWLSAVEPGFDGRLTAPMRPIEDLAAIHPLLVELGEALDHVRARQPDQLVPMLLDETTVSTLREVLAQLGPARMLRLIAWFEDGDLSESERLFDALVRDDLSAAGQLLRNMLRELHRQALLARIFSLERLALLQAITSSQKEAN